MITPTLARGIDVSHWQNIGDWNHIYDSGVRFVGIKATNGMATDPKFLMNCTGARTVPFMLRIYYHYLMPGDAAAQARHLLDVTGTLRDNERLCVDLEHRDAAGKLDVTLDQVETFMAALPTDRRPLLYTSTGIWGELGNPVWPESEHRGSLAQEIRVGSWCGSSSLGSLDLLAAVERWYERWCSWQRGPGCFHGR